MTPTLDVRTLDDPAKWNCVRGIPVFMAHERTFPDGKKVKVTDADLPEIAAKSNARAASYGGVLPLMVGHRKFDPNADERTQPKLTGFGRNYRVGTVAVDGRPTLAVLHDEYTPTDEPGPYRQFPFRSLEYDAGGKVGEGVACLLRPPFLRMGTVYLYHAGGPTVPDMPPTDDDFTPDEVKSYQRMCQYMRKTHPKLAAYMEPVGPTNGTPPAPVDTPVPPMTFSDPAQIAAYAAQTARLAAVEAQLAAEQKARVETECRRMLDPLTAARQFDYAKELATLMGYADTAARMGHVEYIAKNYAHLPGGKMIPVYQGTAHLPAPADDAPAVLKEPERYQETMDYMRSQIAAGKSCSYEDAKAATAAKYAK